MVLRFAALCLLLVVCSSAFSQTSDQPRIYQDPALRITYFYPGRFIPVEIPKQAKDQPKCAQPTFSASSVTPIGTSAFVLSTIDDACPPVLQAASGRLEAFTREQVLRQLQQYGKPVITHDPTSYTIDGHPAAVTIASVEQAPSTDVNSIVPPKVIYAAKACVLGNIPPKRGRVTVTDETRQIVCFDYTTHQKDLLPLMLGFTMQFNGQSPQPIVPGNILR